MHLPPLWASIGTPLPWREWQMSLATHPDRDFANLVVTGIREGFRVGYDYSHTCKKSPKNMQSAREGGQLLMSTCLKSVQRVES